MSAVVPEGRAYSTATGGRSAVTTQNNVHLGRYGGNPQSANPRRKLCVRREGHESFVGRSRSIRWAFGSTAPVELSLLASSSLASWTTTSQRCAVAALLS